MMRRFSAFLAAVFFVSQAWAGTGNLINPYRFTTTSAQTALQVVTALGLTSNLQLVLDAGDSASIKDQYFASNSLLLHGEGSDASTTATDDALGATSTALGNAQTDTAQFKFGASSLLFDGTGDGFTFPDSANYELGSGDFTIELFARFNALPTAGNVVVLVSKGATGTSDASFRTRLVNTAGTYTLDISTATVGTAYATTISKTWSTPTTNTWYHITFLRTGSTVRIYVDGSQIGTDGTDSDTLVDTAGILSIGSTTTGTSSDNGWIDEVRITKGVARTPALPTAAYPDGKWYDTSGNGYDFFFGAATIIGTDDPTINGTPGTLSSAEYLSADGGDYLRLAQSNPTWVNNLHKDNAAFTLIAWIWPKSGGTRNFGTSNNDTSLLGIRWSSDPATTAMTFNVSNGSGGLYALNSGSTTLGVTDGVWQCQILIEDEAGAAWTKSVEGTSSTGTGTYSSPSASAATYTAEILSAGNAASPATSGTRIAMLMAWSSALTLAQAKNVCASTNRFN